MPICPNCGNQAAANAIFCDQCGTRLPTAEPEPEVVVEAPAGGVPEGVLICPDCGAENVPGELFCDVCGNPLEAPEPVAEPAPVPEVVEAEVVAEAVAEEIAGEKKLYCPTCGAELAPGDVFCGNCGAALGEVSIEQEIAPIEPILDEAEGPELAAEEVIIEEVIVEEVPDEEIAAEGEPVLDEEALVEEIAGEQVPLEEAVAPETVITVEEAVTEGELRCPVCGAKVLAGQAFCASCGAALEPVEALPEPEVEIPPIVETAAGPYIEIIESGARVPLIDQAELLIGRVDEISGIYPDVDMTPHGGEEAGVSRRHARLIHEGAAWFIVDLDSTNGTYLNGSELQPKARTPLDDGDRLSLGELEIMFHT